MRAPLVYRNRRTQNNRKPAEGNNFPSLSKIHMDNLAVKIDLPRPACATGKFH
jgi:hypothetical protein